MPRFAVLGATSWGLTLASLLARNADAVTVLCRTTAEAETVRIRGGIARLPELSLPQNIGLAASSTRDDFDGIVVAVPAQSLRTTVEASGLSRDVPVLSAAKGIELGSGLLMHKVFSALGWPQHLVGALSGPNLAHEIVRGLPAAAVVASTLESTASTWQRALSGPAFRVYTTGDITGVELAGAYKNVVAIAAGAGWGLNFGANAVSATMTRGLAEMTRLGVALGANPLTFQGLAGVGDLAVTCFSPLSRNRRFGELLAQGRTVEHARAEIGEAIEGIPTAGVALGLAARHGIELPICEAVAAVVRGEQTVTDAMVGLLARPLRPEAPDPSG